MRDPFPIPIYKPLAEATVPLADKLGLWSLPLHIHEVLFFFVFYTVLQVFISPALSKRYFPDHYNNLKPKTRINWDIHVVSFVQSTLVCALSAYVIATDKERAGFRRSGGLLNHAEGGYWERVFGYTGSLGLVQAAGCGYFLWDLWVSARYMSMFGVGILAHAISALTVFSFGFRPFVNFYAPSFLLYELSSPFLNIHWFCDKMNLTGSKTQLYNGFFLLGTFFFCRLVWGTYASFSVFYDIWLCYTRGMPAGTKFRVAATPSTRAVSTPAHPSREIDLFIDSNTTVPLWMAAAYLASNLTLNSLNWVWMGKMIETIRKRFPPPFGTMKTQDAKLLEKAGAEKQKEPVEVARGVYEDGHRSVELNSTEVRRRPLAQRLESEQVLIP